MSVRVLTNEGEFMDFPTATDWYITRGNTLTPFYDEPRRFFGLSGGRRVWLTTFNSGEWLRVERGPQ